MYVYVSDNVFVGVDFLTMKISPLHTHKQTHIIDIDTHLDVVDGMDILHRVFHHLSQLFESAIVANSCNGVPLDQHIALRQQLYRLYTNTPPCQLVL